jgi:hypothetical protein
MGRIKSPEWLQKRDDISFGRVESSTLFRDTHNEIYIKVITVMCRLSRNSTLNKQIN